MSGDTITEFASAINQYAHQNDSTNVAFNHVIQITRNMSRWVDDWRDDENEDGEGYAPHPFIETESLCFEQYRQSLNRSFAIGDLIGFMLHLKMWLTTYTSQSAPYKPLTEYVFGATEENKRMLSTTREDGTLEPFRKFIPSACSNMYKPRINKCVEIGCVYAKVEDGNYKPSFNGNECSHLSYRFRNLTDIDKHELFGLSIDKELVKRNKDELLKVQALIANKLTSEGLTNSQDANRTFRVNAQALNQLTNEMEE